MDESLVLAALVVLGLIVGGYVAYGPDIRGPLAGDVRAPVAVPATAVPATAVPATAVRAEPVGPEPAAASRTRRALGGPGLWWTVVTALLLANQVIVVAYIRARRGGDPTFVARHLPEGWFDLPTWGWPESLGEGLQAIGLGPCLAWSVLRVPALLELPFVVLATLVVAGFSDPALAARLGRGVGLWGTCLIWSATFAVAEVHFDHPWLRDDLILRGVSALVTPLLVARLSAHRPGPRLHGALDLVLFTVSVAALGGATLLVYDTVLLYNLAHLPRVLAPAAALLLVVVAARFAVRSGFAERARGRVGPTMTTLTGWLVVGLGVVVPAALPLRYQPVLGARTTPMLVSGVVACAVSAVGVSRAGGIVRGRVLAAITVALVAGIAAGVAGLMLGEAWAATYRETAMLAGFTSAVVGVVLVGWACDVVLTRGASQPS